MLLIKNKHQLFKCKLYETELQYEIQVHAEFVTHCVLYNRTFTANNNVKTAYDASLNHTKPEHAPVKVH